jgi:hypothetical protein
LFVHFEQDEICEAVLAEAPGDAETCDASSNYDYWEFFCALCWKKTRAVAQEMAYLKVVVYEGACDGAVRFERESNEGRAAGAKKFAAANLQ